MTTEKKSTAIVPVTERFGALSMSGDFAEATEVNFGGNPGADGVKWTDLERVKMLSGGAPGFEIVDPLTEESESSKTISVVPVFLKHGRAYYGQWRGKATGGAPDCSSGDGVSGAGVVTEGGATGRRKCETCPLAQWGTAIDDQGNAAAGQACKSQAVLFVLRDGAPPESMLPSVVQIPPTSLKSLSKILMVLWGRGLPYYATELELSTVAEKSHAGNKYSKLGAKIKRILGADEKAATKAYHKTLKEQFGGVHIAHDETPTTVREVDSDDQAELEATARAYAPSGDDEHVPF